MEAFQWFGVGVGALLTGLSAVAGAWITYANFSKSAREEKQSNELALIEAGASEALTRREDDVRELQVKLALAQERHSEALHKQSDLQGTVDQLQNMVDYLNPGGANPYDGSPNSPDTPPN